MPDKVRELAQGCDRLAQRVGERGPAPEWTTGASLGACLRIVLRRDTPTGVSFCGVRITEYAWEVHKVKPRSCVMVILVNHERLDQFSSDLNGE